MAERIRLQEWLASEQALNDSIMANASDAVAGLDRSGTIVEWNRAAERTFGWTRDEVLGRPAGQTIAPPGMRDEYGWALARIFGGGLTRLEDPVEAAMRRRDAATIPVELIGWMVEVGHTRRT